MRRVLSVALLVTSITTFVGAQGASPTITPLGVRELRTPRTGIPGADVAVNATEDGWVEMSIDRRLVQRPTDPREAVIAREFFDPDDVLAWADSVDALLRWKPTAPNQESPMRPSIGYQNGHHYMARLFARNGQLDAAITLEHCGSHSSAGATIPPWELAATAAEFRRAAMEARAVRPAVPARAPADAVYWEHSVACPAALRPESPAPTYPSIPLRERRPYQVLAQFVVNTDGRVDTSTFRAANSTDARFAAQVRAVITKWRFDPATRAGRAVRQLVHMPIGFNPPLVDEPGEPACGQGAFGGAVVRPVTPGAALPPGLGTEFLSQVAHALGGSGLPTALRGRRVRFVYSRFQDATMIRPAPSDSGTRLDPLFEREIGSMATSLFGPLPETFRNDAIELEVEFNPSCAHPLTVPLRVSVVSLVPQGDGTVLVSNVDETGADYLMREPVDRHDVVSPSALREWLDAMEQGIARIDTAAWRSGTPAPDMTPGVPFLGGALGTGLHLYLSGHGWLQGGFSCGATQGPLEVMSTEFGAFKRAALTAAALAPRQPRWGRTRSDAYFEHEVGCEAEPMRGNPAPRYPDVGRDPRLSHEVIARLVVDILGRAEPSSVEVMPETDPRFALVVIDAVRAWRFRPAMRGGRPVRALIHMPVVVRPPEADAVVLARRPELRHPEDTLHRTIFFKPNAPPDRPQGATQAQFDEAMRATQPYVDKARASWPSARARFEKGLPTGYELFVTVRLRDAQGRQEQAFVRVERLTGETIRGRIQSDLRLVSGYRRGDPYALPERELVDWTIVNPDGREEGNVVGKFLETYRPARPPQR